MIQTTYNLPFGTHRYFLRELSERPPLQETLQKRFAKFCLQIENSKRPEVIHLFHKQKYDTRSTFGRNYRSVFVTNSELTNYITPESEKWKINVIKELIDVRDSRAIVEHTTAEDAKTLLTRLMCT